MEVAVLILVEARGIRHKMKVGEPFLFFFLKYCVDSRANMQPAIQVKCEGHFPRSKTKLHVFCFHLMIEVNPRAKNVFRGTACVICEPRFCPIVNQRTT
jgi:hypothetical protein